MELDELIRSSGPTAVGAPPSVAALRGRVRRRRARRAAVASVLAVALVGVVVVLSLDGARDDGTVSVQPPEPTDPGRIDGGPAPVSGWSDVGTVPFPTDFSGVQIAAVGDQFVLAATVQAPGPYQPSSVAVRALDRATGGSSDLEFSPADDRMLVSTVGWNDSAVLMTKSGDDVHLDQWTPARWTELPLPDLPSGALAVGLHVIDGRLAFVGLRTTENPGPTGSGDQELLWTSDDGRAWDGPTTLAETSAPSSYIVGSDRVLQVGSPFGKAPWASMARVGNGAWEAVDGYPAGALFPVEGGWIGDTVFACGSHVQYARFDCQSWTEGDDRYKAVDPPPVQPEHGLEGYPAGFRAFVIGERLVVGAQSAAGASHWDVYDPATKAWSSIDPPLANGLPASAIVDSDGAYVALAGANAVTVERLSASVEGVPVPAMVDLGEGLRARIPSDRWRSERVNGGVAVFADATSTDDKGRSCPAERIEFREVSELGSSMPWPGTADITGTTAACVSTTLKASFYARAFEITVWNSAPDQMGTTADLATIIGSFRTASP